MAFYLPEDDRISRAIDEAVRRRNGHILFIAAATAARCSEVRFPASHRYVIAARPLDLRGSLWSDRPLVRKSPSEIVIATLGECMPVASLGHPAQIKGYRSGSSIAAAILVVIAATSLECVDSGSELERKEGMEAALKGLAEAWREEAGIEEPPTSLLMVWDAAE